MDELIAAANTAETNGKDHVSNVRMLVAAIRKFAASRPAPAEPDPARAETFP